VDAYFAVLIGVVGVLAVASALRYYLVITLGERVVADLRAAVFRHLTTLDPAFFDATKSGEIVSRLTADTTQVKSAFGVSISIALRNAFLFVGAIALMTGRARSSPPSCSSPFRSSWFRSSSRAAPCAAAPAPRRTASPTPRPMPRKRSGPSDHAGLRHGALHGLALRDRRRGGFDAARVSTKARSLLTGTAIFLVSASVVGVLWYGAQDVLAGTMTAGRLSQFVLYAVFAASSLGQLSEVYGELAQAAGAAERLGEILETKPAIAAPAAAPRAAGAAAGTVAFEDVRFAYPTRETQAALAGLTFRMRAGERVALVGPSGAARARCCSCSALLRPARGPDPGRRRAGRGGRPRALRARMALVPQEPTIFAGSVLDNIRYGRPGASPEEVRRAARLAAAEDFVLALPQGYDTVIGERGRDALGRPAPAHRDRAGDPQGRPDPPPRRGDLGPRCGERAGGPGRPRPLMRGAHHPGDRPPPRHHPLGGPHPVLDGGGSWRRARTRALLAQGGLYARLARLQFTDEDGRALAAE
jgi:ATP-binding cassette subfamily B protein